MCRESVAPTSMPILRSLRFSAVRPHVNVRKLLVIAIALSVVPFASHAKQGPQAALDACIKAFVESHLSGRQVRRLASADFTVSLR